MKKRAQVDMDGTEVGLPSSSSMATSSSVPRTEGAGGGVVVGSSSSGVTAPGGGEHSRTAAALVASADSASRGEPDDRLAWAAEDFVGCEWQACRAGVDPTSLRHLEPFADWLGREELGWPESEDGFVNSGTDCFLISLIQMLGTARRVRDAIAMLPLRAGDEKSLEDRVTRVLKHDFVRDCPGDRFCASAWNCSYFTEGQQTPEPFVRGSQSDVEEAFRHLMGAWAVAEETSQICGRSG